MAYTPQDAKSIVAGALNGLKNNPGPGTTCAPTPNNMPTSKGQTAVGKVAAKPASRDLRALPAPMTPHQQPTSLSDPALSMPVPKAIKQTALPEKIARAKAPKVPKAVKTNVKNTLFPGQKVTPRQPSVDAVPASPKMPKGAY